VFVDIGSNVGYFSVAAAELGAEVWAFEANPSLARLLRKTTAFNDFYINTFPYAVSDRAEELTLYVPGEYQGSASITADFDGQYPTKKIHTSSITFDELKVFNLKAPTLIKMDIEGAEEKAWDGMKNTLARHKPVVVLEYTSGRYSNRFPKKLADYGNLSKINHQGEEEFLFPEQLESFPEFEMVVVRPNV
jgi:FkbM family methyltransferase